MKKGDMAFSVKTLIELTLVIIIILLALLFIQNFNIIKEGFNDFLANIAIFK